MRENEERKEQNKKNRELKASVGYIKEMGAMAVHGRVRGRICGRVHGRVQFCASV